MTWRRAPRWRRDIIVAFDVITRLLFVIDFTSECDGEHGN